MLSKVEMDVADFPHFDLKSAVPLSRLRSDGTAHSIANSSVFCIWSVGHPDHEGCTKRGQHLFSTYQIPRPLKCGMCDRRHAAGADFFGCEDCSWDICQLCHSESKGLPVGGRGRESLSTDRSSRGCSTWTSQESGSWVSGEASMRTEERCVQVDSRGSVRSGSKRKMDNTPFSDASTMAPSRPGSQCELRLPCIGEGEELSLIGEDEENIDPSEELPPVIAARSSGKPVCILCAVSFKGFGKVCADCRSQGPGGGIHSCNQCGQFFQGFGASCMECREASTMLNAY